MTEQEYNEIMDNSNFLIDSANPYDMAIKEKYTYLDAVGTGELRKIANEILGVENYG